MILIVELCVWLLAGLLVVTQLVIPLYSHTPLFPYFRSTWQLDHAKRVEKLHDNINGAKGELEEEELERLLEELRKKKTTKNQ